MINRIKVNGTLERCRTFDEGMPRGSVSLLLLSTIFISDLLSYFNESAMLSAYADEFAIACRMDNTEMVTTKRKREVDHVGRWREDVQLQLEISKCKVTAYSTDTVDSRLTVNAMPKLLACGKTAL